MARYHINPATGNPGACSAAEGNCPFKGAEGEESTHYPSASAAREGYEQQQGAFAGLTKVERTDEEVPVESPIMVGTFTVDRTFPASAWAAYQEKWEQQGLAEVSDRLVALRDTEPGTAEYVKAFGDFESAYEVAAEKNLDAYMTAIPELIQRKYAFQRVHDGREGAEAVSRAAYAYLDAYAASVSVNERNSSFLEMRDQLVTQLSNAPESARKLLGEFDARDRRRYNGAPTRPAFERLALKSAELSSVKLLRYQHLGGGFVERYDEAVAAENAKPRGLFSRLRRRPSVTSVK
jgi:hypothetical protein